MIKIITICGPTGIGKTGFAIALARELNGEIIGADSMQIYKYMDVGTAKPDQKERQLAVHHLVDFLDPADDFDAKRFTALADQAISDIAKRGRVPVIAGGTGLYIRALLHGLFRGKPACPAVITSYSIHYTKLYDLFKSFYGHVVFKLYEHGSTPGHKG